MSVSVITPWVEHPELVEGYAQVVAGADEVLVVLNRGDVRMFDGTGFRIVRPHAALGFAASNNHAAEFATGDVIVYLNNDVVGAPDLIDHVREDVRDGALYGPSIGAQRLAGVVVPYVEGWCVAATRATWERVGPWDAEAFPKPYWEDVDLSLRAVRAGCELNRAPWPIRHLGGTTTSTEPGAWDGFEAQRQVMERRVEEILCAS